MHSLRVPAKPGVRYRVCSVGSRLAAGRSGPHALSYFVVYDSSGSLGDQNTLRRGSDVVDRWAAPGGPRWPAEIASAREALAGLRREL